jgi:hypothetical protein
MKRADITARTSRQSWARSEVVYRGLHDLFGETVEVLQSLTDARETLRVIKIVSKGKAGLNTGEAAEFQHLLPETESAEEDDGEILV